jgi:pimeloyl-ACP methyl ester carboxylesterase
MILNWMNLFYRFRMKAMSPERLAPRLPMPAMVIHGAEDRRFPARFARRLHQAFPAGSARLLVVPGAGHSESSGHPQYPQAIADFLAAYPEACAATLPPAHRRWS